MLRVILHKNEEERIFKGHPWIFSNEIKGFEGNIISGDVCLVYSEDRRFIGKGFLNTTSKIMIRMLTSNLDEKIDYEFFKKRIIEAKERRNGIGINETGRMVFSEADLLPGLIVDKYGEYLSVQFLSLGMDKIKTMIVDILVSVFSPKGIVERSDVSIRKKEGLEENKGILYGLLEDEVIVTENDIKLKIDLMNGQKTGYFLDQRNNRLRLKNYVYGKEVLDCFSHTGAFALNACHFNALHVDAVDISEKACEDITYNAKLNNATNLNVICSDVFDYLEKPEIDQKYDVIILDPPAFTKSKETVKKAYRGYLNINLQAMRIIKSGGYLFTYSCSQHMTFELFLEMLREAGELSKRTIQLVDIGMQSPDHPMLLVSDESFYLKCFVLRIC